MTDFFPHGFWSGMAMLWMVIFFLFGVDLLLFRARFVSGLGHFVNKRVHVDQIVIRLLESFKKASDHEVDVEHALLGGRGRLLAGGVLIVAAFLVYKLLPALK